MPRYKGLKMDYTNFEPIPKKEKVESTRELILKNLQKRYKLKHERELLIQQNKETRKKVYNLSLEITKIEDENDDLLFKNGFTL